MSSSATLPPPVPSVRTNGLAIVALVAGVISFLGGILLLFLPTLAAIICGHVAQSQCRKDPMLKG